MAVQAEEIYSVSELSEASGFGQTFLRDRIADGSLPARDFGRRMVKIKGKDFLQWFDDQPLKLANTDSSEEDESTDGKSNGQTQMGVETKALISALR